MVTLTQHSVQALWDAIPEIRFRVPRAGAGLDEVISLDGVISMCGKQIN